MTRLLTVMLVALLLVGCAEQDQTTTINPTIQTSSAHTTGIRPAFVEEAHRYLQAHPHRLEHRWQQVIVAATGMSGPEERRRWNAVVVWANGQMGVVTSDQGVSHALNLLVQPGDHLDVHLRWATLNPADTRVLAKQAVIP